MAFIAEQLKPLAQVHIQPNNWKELIVMHICITACTQAETEVQLHIPSFDGGEFSFAPVNTDKPIVVFTGGQATFVATGDLLIERNHGHAVTLSGTIDHLETYTGTLVIVQGNKIVCLEITRSRGKLTILMKLTETQG